ncbi:MAG: alpha-L-arabinofuranosidase C-terminal domain-containing protein [Acidimicrobiales bacterium]
MALGVHRSMAVLGLVASLMSPTATVAPGVVTWSSPSVPEIVIGGRPIGRASPYLFGGNVLWADNAEGAYDLTKGTFYPGFVTALRRTGVTILRYPGGTTSDSFDWLRAIGPQEHRGPNEPYGIQAAHISRACCVLDGPQHSTVGPDEFGKLLDQLHAVGLVTVNFATGTAQQAADFVAYMTAPLTRHPSSNPLQPSYWAALRAKNGHPAPYNVPYWEVGNEQSFPGQYGWRSGQLVNLGPRSVPCPPSQAPTCEYIFGGTTHFSNQPVGTFADELPSASYSTGAGHQKFYLYYPPAVPGTVTIYVAGSPWRAVGNLSLAGPDAHVYTLDPATGAITFGDGRHGSIPPAGAQVTATYNSGPHGGFIDFYQAMKRMNPHIRVCASEETNVTFLQLMGTRYPYDCVELHEYARLPDITAPLHLYEEALMAYPAREARDLARLQSEVRHYSGRDIPVFITEYGQLVAPVPVADPAFNLSLYEGLFEAAQLFEWMKHGVPVAEKYLAESAPFTAYRLTGAVARRGLRKEALESQTVRRAIDIGKAMVNTGLSPDSGMVANWGGTFLDEPTGQVLGLMSSLGGEQLLNVAVRDAPVLPDAGRARALWAVAAESRTGQVDIVVINASPTEPFLAQVDLRDKKNFSQVDASVLDGPSPTAYNTPARPDLVHVTSYATPLTGKHFYWRFPAHSLTLLRLRPPSVAG